MLRALLLVAPLLPPIAGPPRTALVGGPTLLWPQIIREYERRYPSQPAIWIAEANGDSDPQDLVFAYYPTLDELKPTAGWSSARWLGFPTGFAGAAWKHEIDQEGSALAYRYLDEGGVENGVRLLAYLYSLARTGGAPVD